MRHLRDGGAEAEHRGVTSHGPEHRASLPARLAEAGLLQGDVEGLPELDVLIAACRVRAPAPPQERSSSGADSALLVLTHAQEPNVLLVPGLPLAHPLQRDEIVDARKAQLDARSRVPEHR